MENSRLLELFSIFSPKEIKEIRKLIASPFFNQREDVRAFFELLTEQSAALTKAEVSARLFPDEPFEPQRIRQLMSWLHQLLEEYLFLQSVRTDKEQVKLEMAGIFRSRNLNRHFSAAVREAQNLSERSPLLNGERHRKNYLLLQEKHSSAGSRQRTGEQHLQALSDEHDAFYITEKLRQACLIRSHQAVNKVEYNLDFLTYLLPHLNTDHWEKWPAAGIYFFSFKMLDSEDGRPYFQQLKIGLGKHRSIFPPNELRDVYLFAINFSIRQLNGGDEAYGREAFHLYKNALSSNLLTLEGNISRFAYRNIVALGLKLQEYEWVEQFLLEYKDALEAPHREATFSFNLAKLEYERKNFDAAILLLHKADYKDILLNLAAKTLLLKIYFLLDEQRLLDSHLSAMRRFVKRKKMVGYHRENYLNITLITKKLTEVNPFDRAAIATLEKEIESTDPLTERKWLLEQVGGY